MTTTAVARSGQRVRTVGGGQCIGLECDEGPDSQRPQLVGSGAGTADPATRGTQRNIQLLGEHAVHLALLRGADQRVAGHPGAAAAPGPAAWRPAAHAWSGSRCSGPVRAHRDRRPCQASHRSEYGVRPHGARTAPQSAQRSIRAASACRAAATSTTSINTHRGQSQSPLALARQGAVRVAPWPTSNRPHKTDATSGAQRVRPSFSSGKQPAVRRHGAAADEPRTQGDSFRRQSVTHTSAQRDAGAGRGGLCKRRRVRGPTASLRARPSRRGDRAGLVAAAEQLVYDGHTATVRDGCASEDRPPSLAQPPRRGVRLLDAGHDVAFGEQHRKRGAVVPRDS